MTDSLQSLVNHAAFLSAEVQQRFGVLIAGNAPDFDFSENPRLSFTGDETVDFRPHMIGASVNRTQENTWHWGWENIHEFPDPVVVLSRMVHEYGEQKSIAQLTAPELPLDPENLPLALTLAAKAITGAWAHYPAEAGGGTTMWVLVDDKRLSLGEPELKPIVRAIASGITGVEVSDHQQALESYVALRGLRTAPLPDGGVRILCADGSADVLFDEQSKIMSCQAHPVLEGDAAEQFAAAEPVEGTATFGAIVIEAADSAPVREEAPAVEAEEPVTAPDASSTPPTAVDEDAPSSAEAEKKGFFKRLFGR